MDDVFDQDEDEKQAELKLGSREWLRRAEEVYLAGEREGIFASRELLLQNDFNSGLQQGFELLDGVSIIKGRMLIKSHLHPQDDMVPKEIIRSCKQIEQDIFAQSSLSTFSPIHLKELETSAKNFLHKMT